MPDRFDWFVHNENIKNYERQIESETDPDRLAQLRLLLKVERERPMKAAPR